MTITERQVTRTSRELRHELGPDLEVSFAFLHLQQHFNLPADRALGQLMLGGRGIGLTAFHYDRDSRNLYLLIHRWGMNLRNFRAPLDALAQRGLNELFHGSGTAEQLLGLSALLGEEAGGGDPLPRLSSLRAVITEHQEAISQVIITLVFNGDPEKARQSPLMPYFDEEVTSRKHVAADFFGRDLKVFVEILSARDGTRVITTTGKSQRYDLEMTSVLDWSVPTKVQMQIGFIRLADLGKMYKDIGIRFFESNVRAGLDDDEAPNRAITAALRDILLDKSVEPQVFAFNHNGVTLCVESLEPHSRGTTIVNPRLLNGAQTVSTFSRFMEKEGLRYSNERLSNLKVLAKLILSPDDRFTAQVTINNNRQNPVMPWNLRANDAIQLSLQDWFLDELGIYYERQDNAFAALSDLSDADLSKFGILTDRCLKLVKLAGTFLAADGRVDKMGRMKEVFEGDDTYIGTFNEKRMLANPRGVVVCYKIDRCVRKLLKELNAESSAGRYAFLYKGRNLFWSLLWQAFANDTENVDDHLAQYGEDLVVSQSFRSLFAGYARNRVRPVINALTEQEPYDKMMSEEKYGFLSTRNAYDRAMAIAANKFDWSKRGFPT